MFKKDIDRLFSEKVAEFIAQGFWIHTASMHGSEGEIAKVDLTNGKVLYRLLMESGWKSDYVVGADIVRLVLGRVKEEDFRSNSVWNKRLERLEVREFHQLSRYRDYYIESSDSLLRLMSHKAVERWKCRQTKNEVDLTDIPGVRQAAVKYLRRQKGFKTAKEVVVDRVFRRKEVGHYGVVHTCYYVESKGKRFWVQ